MNDTIRKTTIELTYLKIIIKVRMSTNGLFSPKNTNAS